MKVAVIALALGLAPAALAAEQSFTAANGTVVSLSTDEFRPNRDVTAPLISDRKSGASYIYAYRVNNDGTGAHMIQGFVNYSGRWRFYDRAYLRGGERAEFSSMGRNVGYCGRYGGCSLRESFMVTLNDKQLASARAYGALVVQIGSSSPGAAAILTVPDTHLDAVDEIVAVALPKP